MKEVKRYTVANCWEKLGNETEVVAAADYDSLLRKFAEVERDAARYRAARQMLCYPYANIAGTVFRNEHDCDKACDEWFAAMPGEG